MNSTNTIFLDGTYTIDGVEMTGEEIKDAIIDSILFRKHFKELKGDAE